MAFTDPQKAQIKARAQELIATGMQPGPAAQQAARELFTAQPEIRQQFETPPPPPRTVSPEFPVAEREAERQEQLREIAQLQESPKPGSVETAEQAYRSRRVRELKRQDPNLSDAAAAAIAQREFAEEFKQPVPFGYGAPEERAEEGRGVRAAETIASAVPVIGPALERQVEEVVPFTQREEEVIGQPGVGVDWNLVQQKFVEDLQIPEDEVAADVDSFKQNFYRPALQSARDEGLEGTEAVQAALDTAFQEFADMGRRLQDKESYIRDEPTTRGPADRWFETFSRQETIGEGIPDLTPAQRAYLSDREQRAIEAEVDRRMETRPTTDLQSGDFRLMTRDEVRAEVENEMQTWWLQEDYQERINRPDIYTDYGILQDVSPLGTRKETVSGWLLRSAMAPFNIVPAIAAEAVAPGEEVDFTDRILTNVAENRGFMGEGEAIMEERGITAETAPYQYYGGMTLGFALDLLDPSIDIAKAGTAAAGGFGRYTLNMGDLYGRLGRQDLTEALAFGFNKGRESFVNDYIITNLVGARYDAGSVRNVASNRMRKDIDAAIQAEDILRANPSATADDALRQLSAYKGTAYYNSLATRSGQPLSDAIEASRNIIKTSDNVLERAGKISDDLERMAQGGQPRTLTRADVSRVVRSLAIFNNQIKQAFKADGVKGILANDNTRELFRKGIAADEAVRAVGKSTRGNFFRTTDIDNIVALTDNTYAGRRSAKEIIDRVKKAPLGKLITGLNPENLKLVINDSRFAGKGAVVPAYDLAKNDDLQDKLYRAISELEDIGAISSARASGIRLNIANHKALLVEDSRYLLDKLTDVIAEARALGKQGSVIRAIDIAQMTPQRQMELLEPLERRTLATRALRTLYRKLRGDKPIELFAGPAQRNMLKRAAVEGEAIVSRLGTRLKELVNNKKMQEAYGVPEGTKLDPQSALQYLIVGARSPIRAATNISGEIVENLKYTLSSVFQTDKTIENLFDTIAGTSVRTNTSPLSEALFKKIEERLQIAASNIERQPTKYFSELQGLIGEIESLMRSDPGLFRGPVDDIKVLKSQDGKIPTDVQIIPYIKAESDRITARLLEDFVESAVDRFGGEDLFTSILSTKGPPKTQEAFKELFDLVKTSRKLITDSIRFKLQGKNLLEIYQDDPAELIKLIGTPKNMRPEDIERALKIANDFSNHVMKANRMAKSDFNINELERLVNSIFDNPRGEQALRALYGEDVASQLSNEFRSGFSKVRDQLVNDLRYRYKVGGIAERRAKDFKAIADAIQNIRYLIMLNMRPRFHGVNLLTASEIYYQNLGRTPDISRVMQAAGILSGAIPRNKVVLTTPTGKRYTAGEMADILRDATGKSIYRPDLFNTSDDLNAVRLLIDNPDEFIGTRAGRTAGKFVRDLPQNEDLTFRYSALAQALKEGRSEAEAIELARKSMFDRADISDLERKTIGRAALFYSFARSALATALRNLTSVKGLKRIKNIARSRDYAQDMLLPEGTEERRIADFAPNYAASRIVTQVKPTKAEEGKYEILTTPGIPTLQSFETFAEILKGNISGVIGGFISPEYKALLNIQDPYAREYKEVPAEHLAILNSISNAYGFDTTDSTIRFIMERFGGVPSDIVPTPRRNPDGSVSMSYQFTTSSQKKAYRDFMAAMGILGLSTIASDLGRAFTPEPVRGSQFDEGRRLGDLRQDVLGFTPMTTYTPEKQAYFDRLGRMKAMQAAANELASAQDDRIDALLPPTEQQQRMEESIERGQERREEALRQLSPQTRGTIRTAEEIRRERDMLMNREAAREMLEDQRRRLREQRPQRPQRPQ